MEVINNKVSNMKNGKEKEEDEKKKKKMKNKIKEKMIKKKNINRIKRIIYKMNYIGLSNFIKYAKDMSLVTESM